MCVSAKKNMHKRILSKDTKKGLVSNKNILGFWQAFFNKTFLKMTLSLLKIALAETFNDYYVNIVETSCKTKLQFFASLSSVTGDESVINDIL